MQVIKRLFNKFNNPILYPLQNQSFKHFDVIFGNTTKILTKEVHTKISNDSVCYTLPLYKTVDNEPHMLTMTVYSLPTVDVTINCDDDNKCVKINLSSNSFVQKEDRAFMVSRETTKMIDITKYHYFSVDDNS
jgi:hypothetical protein